MVKADGNYAEFFARNLTVNQGNAPTPTSAITETVTLTSSLPTETPIPTLTFTPALSGDTESYDVVVTAPACGGGFLVTTSAAGILAVTGTNPCPADFNIDGELNPDDLADFIGAFFAGCG